MDGDIPAGASDFDFLLGDWRVRHRRLVGDREWVAFGGTTSTRPIRVRFLWSPLTADSCRWEQAFSADSEVSWETNWVMEFDRA